ncbi:MAG: response regulator [Calditrichia bacterium]
MLNATQQNATILIVEDNPESVNLLTYFLEPAGYRVVVAQTGTEAVSAVEREKPDMILLDVVLPEMNGFEICERLKKNQETFHIPIIMITALKELKDKIKGLEAGADDFITKPFENVELLTRVKSLLRLKFYHDELRRRNKELEKQKTALEREDHLKKELTNLIVHDMKNPLFVIQGNLQMMEMNQEALHQQDPLVYTSRIARSSRSLLRMILNLLDISRLEQNLLEIEPVPADLRAMTEEVIAAYQDIPEHQHKTVHLKCGEDPDSVYVDKDIFERVLDNLMTYVFANTPPNMSIFIECRQNGETARLMISHDGTPIPNKFKQKIFSKNAQPELKEAGFKPARGLGLIFCRLALEAQNGRIFLDNACEDRNCFVVEVPVFSF